MVEVSGQLRLTVFQLQSWVADWISPTIEEHRQARRRREANYDYPIGDVTDDEVHDFVLSHPNLDEDAVMHFIDLALIADEGVTTKEWVSRFKESVVNWAQSDEWRSASLPWLSHPQADSRLWFPSQQHRPGWIDILPASLGLAVDLIRSGRLLSDLDWRSFELLLGELLEREGFEVLVTRGTRDGGVDVIAERDDVVLGPIRTLWQAKKYAPERKVRLCQVRELSAIRASDGATKSIIVTTGSLTRDAIKWIKQDEYRMSYREGADIEAWVKRLVFGTDS